MKQTPKTNNMTSLTERKANEFKSYVYTEKEAQKAWGMYSDLVGYNDEQADKYEARAKALEDKICDQVCAACEAWGITGMEYIDELNEWTEAKAA